MAFFFLDAINCEITSHETQTDAVIEISEASLDQDIVEVLKSSEQLRCGETVPKLSYKEADYEHFQILHPTSLNISNGKLSIDVDGLSDVTRSEFYTISSQTGFRLFRVEFDTAGFDSANLTVMIANGQLDVCALQDASHNMEAGSMRSNGKVFRRILKLPHDVDSNQVQGRLEDGRLIIEAVVDKRPCSEQGVSGSAEIVCDVEMAESINKPVVAMREDGTRFLFLMVDAGRSFEAGDFLVRLRDRKKIFVDASRQEIFPRSRMTVNFSREFDLDVRLVPSSLEAGLTEDGFLKIFADVLEETL